MKKKVKNLNIRKIKVKRKYQKNQVINLIIQANMKIAQKHLLILIIVVKIMILKKLMKKKN